MENILLIINIILAVLLVIFVLFQKSEGGAQDKIKKMEDCGITIASSPSKIGETLFDKLSN